VLPGKTRNNPDGKTKTNRSAGKTKKKLESEIPQWNRVREARRTVELVDLRTETNKKEKRQRWSDGRSWSFNRSGTKLGAVVGCAPISAG